jgi:hypothetical protein
MRAIKLQAHIEKDHTLNLKLPEDVREGPAEVIVLVPDLAAKPTHSLGDFLARLPQHPSQLRTKEEIDGYLEREREDADDTRGARQPHPAIVGKMKIHGEVFDSAPEDDWTPRGSS